MLALCLSCKNNQFQIFLQIYLGLHEKNGFKYQKTLISDPVFAIILLSDFGKVGEPLWVLDSLEQGKHVYYPCASVPLLGANKTLCVQNTALSGLQVDLYQIIVSLELPLPLLHSLHCREKPGTTCST